MICALLSVLELYKSTVGISQEGEIMVSVFQTVYSQCILIIVSLLYYCLFKLCILILYPPSITRSRGSSVTVPGSDKLQADPVVLSADRSNGSSASRGHQNRTSMGTRLTIRNVWVLVYGLGFVFFITGYCFLGLQPVCLTFIGLAVGVLSVDEILCPRREFQNWYSASRSLVLLITLVSLVLVASSVLDSVVSRYISTMDIYSLVFGLLFPFCSQFILIIIRDSQHHTLDSVLEVCEFGFPFTAFLGIFHLCVAYGQRYQSDSDAISVYYYNQSRQTGDYLDFRYWYHYNDSSVNKVIETDGPFLLFYMLTPFVMIPAVVCYMSCVLSGCAIDPLLSITFVMCVENLLVHADAANTTTDHSPSALGITALVLCSIALVMRVVSEYRPTFVRDHFSLQTDSTQLPHHIVWRRPDVAATMSDCEAETQELSSDFSELEH